MLTEPDCERSFAQERIQFSTGRGWFDPHTRESGIKVVIDGLDLDQLQSFTHFWTSSCQNRYAEVWGSRAQGNRKERKDCGHSMPGGVCISASLAGVTRQRNEALTVAVDRLLDRTLLGHPHGGVDAGCSRKEAAGPPAEGFNE